MFRVSQLSVFELLPAEPTSRKSLLDVISGVLYFFSREKPSEVHFRTPTAVGAIRGTEFQLQVLADGTTQLALLDGEVELGNAAGQVVLHGGEQASVVQGRPPVKTALIDAINTIQWCLYYPAVLDPAELNFTPSETNLLSESLAAYREGDLLKALAALPAHVPSSDTTLIYQAAVKLSVGRVDDAEKLLRRGPASAPLALALREMIAAVQGKTWTNSRPPVLASQWLAHSYYLQSQDRLDDALQAARMAVAKSPSFGFGWARVAELEFGFARIDQANQALDKALATVPRDAQALALKGFMAAANGRRDEALAWLDKAIATDGALGNAWLGRGLVRIRNGQAEAGRQDLQVAATLEPQRALLRSYLAKAFAHEGKFKLAEKDLRLAKKLDPNDPTAWLYAALLNQQRNRINEAVRDLEASQDRNDNRQLYRSKLLLDEDRAVRSANLAAIYTDDGMTDVGVREARKAVDADYANFSSHLFLAGSYDAMRDPKLYNLRYETPAKAEWLLANLLAPVGASTLSRNLSLQDYSRLFECDRLGFDSSTEYFSNGEWVQSASQYGHYGKLAYSLDGFYHRDPGQRPNNDLEQFQLAAQVKVQLTRDDSVFLGVEEFTQRTGDIIQYYSQTNFNPTLRVKERQEPNLFLGYHHEWNPGSHTLFLFTRLDDTLEQSTRGIERPFVKFGNGSANPPTSILSRSFDFDYERDYSAYSTELQQIWQTHAHAVIAGGRYQFGWADTTSPLTLVFPYPKHMAAASDTSMDRLSLYSYYQWQIWEPLRLTAGVSYDRLHYPRNVDTPPVSNLENTAEKVSPKVGLIYAPWKNGTFRGMFTRSLGGFLHENSFQLEPTQMAGFNQSFRSIIPESIEGLLSGATFQTGALGFDQNFSTGTYLSVEGEWQTSDADKWLGAVTSTQPFAEPDLPYLRPPAASLRGEVTALHGQPTPGQRMVAGRAVSSERSHAARAVPGLARRTAEFFESQPDAG